jgi:hypothetical protein
MHAGIDAFVALALARKDEPDRAATIPAAMYEYLSGRITEHGFSGDQDALWSLVEMDVVLNSQGLVAWLARQEKQDG